MTVGRLVAAAGVAVGLTLGACSGSDSSDDPAAFHLDGSARPADDEGILTAISNSSVTIGDRQYRITPELQVVSAHDRRPTPLIRWADDYVQVGVDDDTVVWLVGVAEVFGGDPPTIVVPGTVTSIDDDRLVLDGGLTFHLDDGLDAGGVETGVYVIVTVDAVDGIVTHIA